MRLPQGLGPACWLRESRGETDSRTAGTQKLMPWLRWQLMGLKGRDGQWLDTLDPVKEGLELRKTGFNTLVCPGVPELSWSGGSADY